MEMRIRILNCTPNQITWLVAELKRRGLLRGLVEISWRQQPPVVSIVGTSREDIEEFFAQKGISAEVLPG